MMTRITKQRYWRAVLILLGIGVAALWHNGQCQIHVTFVVVPPDNALVSQGSDFDSKDRVSSYNEDVGQ